MKRREFLTSLLATTTLSCFGQGKKISVDPDFFEKASYIDNGGQQLYEYNLKGKKIYLTPNIKKDLKIKKGAKFPNLIGLEIAGTNTTYEGNDIHNIEILILSDSTSQR